MGALATTIADSRLRLVIPLASRHSDVRRCRWHCARRGDGGQACGSVGRRVPRQGREIEPRIRAVRRRRGPRVGGSDRRRTVVESIACLRPGGDLRRLAWLSGEHPQAGASAGDIRRAGAARGRCRVGRQRRSSNCRPRQEGAPSRRSRGVSSGRRCSPQPRRAGSRAGRPHAPGRGRQVTHGRRRRFRL